MDDENNLPMFAMARISKYLVKVIMISHQSVFCVYLLNQGIEVCTMTQLMNSGLKFQSTTLILCLHTLNTENTDVFTLILRYY